MFDSQVFSPTIIILNNQATIKQQQQQPIDQNNNQTQIKMLKEEPQFQPKAPTNNSYRCIIIIIRIVNTNDKISILY